MDDSNIVYDLCIIGAGMFGCAAAKCASTFQKARICLIGPEEPMKEEWEHRRIFSSHYDEGRIVGEQLLNDPLNVLAKETIQEFQSLDKISGEELFSGVGCLFLFDHAHEYISVISNEIKSGKSELLNISSESNFTEKFPYLKKDDYKYAFLNLSSGYVSPREILKRGKLMAEKNGCCIFNETVKDIEEVDSGLFTINTDCRRVIRAKKLLICAGAFTSFIPLQRAKELNIKIAKETCILIRISDQEAKRLRNMPVMDISIESFEKQPFLKGAYILPPIKYPDGKYYIKIGHTGSIVNSELSSLDEIRNWYLSNGDSYIAEKYLKIIQNLIPGLEIEEVVPKTCVTCSNPSGLPYIDCILPNVTVATVGNGSGVTMCEAVGRIAAKLSLEAVWDSKLPKTLFQAIYRSS